MPVEPPPDDPIGVGDPVRDRVELQVGGARMPAPFIRGTCRVIRPLHDRRIEVLAVVPARAPITIERTPAIAGIAIAATHGARRPEARERPGRCRRRHDVGGILEFHRARSPQTDGAVLQIDRQGGRGPRTRPHPALGRQQV